MILFGRIEDSFAITGRGLVVVFSWLGDVRIRPGDKIQLRSPNGQVHNTFIVGLEMVCGPNVDRTKTGLMLPREESKQDVPQGAEIWFIEAASRG